MENRGLAFIRERQVPEFRRRSLFLRAIVAVLGGATGAGIFLLVESQVNLYNVFQNLLSYDMYFVTGDALSSAVGISAGFLYGTYKDRKERIKRENEDDYYNRVYAQDAERVSRLESLHDDPVYSSMRGANPDHADALYLDWVGLHLAANPAETIRTAEEGMENRKLLDACVRSIVQGASVEERLVFTPILTDQEGVELIDQLLESGDLEHALDVTNATLREDPDIRKEYRYRIAKSQIDLAEEFTAEEQSWSTAEGHLAVAEKIVNEPGEGFVHKIGPRWHKLSVTEEPDEGLLRRISTLYFKIGDLPSAGRVYGQLNDNEGLKQVVRGLTNVVQGYSARSED